MNFKSLVKAAELRELHAADLTLPGVPAGGKRLLQALSSQLGGQRAAWVRQHAFDSDLLLSSYEAASSAWYADRRIRVLLWDGDLTIDGDLLDDDFSLQPLLVVRGSLSVRHWLRGGMPGFIGGDVRASGFIVGHYNDSALFVGGGLSASGYLPRARPYPEFREVAPHQVAGPVHARRIDIADASSETLAEAFVEEVLVREEEDGEEYVSVDERAVFARFNDGLPVWR